MTRHPHLYQLIEAHHQSILPIEIHDLRAVIEEPAALLDVQLAFEGNPVGDLLFEAQSQHHWQNEAASGILEAGGKTFLSSS